MKEKIKELSEYVDEYIVKCQASPTHKEEYYKELKQFVKKQASEIFELSEEELQDKKPSELYKYVISSNLEHDPDKRIIISNYLALVNLLNINN